MSRPAYRLLLLVATILLGFALRISCLGCESLWIDEVDSLYWATIPVVDMVLDTVNHVHTPGYYLLLNAAINLSGISEFSLRFVSVWSGLFLIPLGYWAAHTIWREQRVGYLTAFLFAISPAHINYSQETRMYALLPLLYVMMLALVLRPRSLTKQRDWTLLAILEVLALYLHPFSGLMLLAINVLIILILADDRSRYSTRSWLLSQFTVVLLFVPWLWLVWQSGGQLPPNLMGNAGNASAGVADYLGLLWYFLNSGIVTNLPLLEMLTTLLALFCAVALPFLLYLEGNRRALAGQFVSLLIPLFAAYGLWRINPLTHPRYLFFLITPLVLLLGRQLSLLSMQRGTSWLMVIGLLLLLTSNATAVAHRSEDSFNMRSLAAEIAGRATAEDLVLMPPYDKSLWYYDPSPATARDWPLLRGNQEARISQLGSMLKGHDDVFVVQYDDLYSHDPQQLLPYIMELNGALQEQFSVDRMTVSHYSLHENWRSPQFESFSAACGPFSLTAFLSERTAQPASAIAVALHWQLRESITEDITVSLRLRDDDQQLAGHDILLLDGQHVPTSEWAAGQQTTSYHHLPVPLGTPPLTYTVAVRLVNANGTAETCSDSPQGLALTEIRVQPDPTQEQDPYGSWADTEWKQPRTASIAPGLTLEGYTIRPDALRPAQSAFITLRWRATAQLQQAHMPLLELRQSENVLASNAGMLFKRYPTTKWQEGELLIETRELAVPATLAPFQLTLTIDNQTIPIATLAIASKSLSWELPPDATPLCARLGNVAELAGYGWQRPARDADSVILTLYWRGLDGATTGPSYTVFSHILGPDGQLVAQHDSIPVGGERPTDSWLPGEIIVDEHPLPLAELDQSPLRLSAGMYNLSNGERLPAFDCNSQRLPEDAIPIGVLQGGELE